MSALDWSGVLVYIRDDELVGGADTGKAPSSRMKLSRNMDILACHSPSPALSEAIATPASPAAHETRWDKSARLRNTSWEPQLRCDRPD
ncbi:MAG: hypothetical protein M1831_002974 [Alyxoria varia]|nr:MAG: hypothetical protein M1831_002974 [Alyxoria varia]